MFVVLCQRTRRSVSCGKRKIKNIFFEGEEVKGKGRFRKVRESGFANAVDLEVGLLDMYIIGE